MKKEITQKKNKSAKTACNGGGNGSVSGNGGMKSHDGPHTHVRHFKTMAGIPVERVYTEKDVNTASLKKNLGAPGEFPFTRGVYSTMYRTKLWTMRQFAGYGTAKDTNKRFKYLLSHGETGLSVAFDMPTLMGRDSDDERSLGEVGKGGVAIDTLADMETLFSGIPIKDITTSMTINGPAAIVWAMYLVVAQKQGADLKKISGTIQNDILKEYMAQNEWLFPPRPSLKLVIDTFEFGSKYVPRWNTISISGYHIREAGSTAVQEMAFTLYNGKTYVKEAVKAGLDVDLFAPRLSFFFNCHMDFFEEVAKFRAARRIWAKWLKDEFKAKDPRSWLLRFHTQTAGCSLTEQQPENNVTRTTLEALAAVMGGTQSLHTNSLDEALALPSEKAVRIALRTQQIIAHESGVTNTADPLGGSYFVEALTDKMEEEANKYFTKIEELGGVVAGIEEGFFQKEIARSAYEFQKHVETKERVVVGVNDYTDGNEETNIELLRIPPHAEKEQLKFLRETKKNRNALTVQHSLEQLKRDAEAKKNLMPAIMNAVKAYAALGEMVGALKDVYGTYPEKMIL